MFGIAMQVKPSENCFRNQYIKLILKRTIKQIFKKKKKEHTSLHTENYTPDKMWKQIFKNIFSARAFFVLTLSYTETTEVSHEIK